MEPTPRHDDDLLEAEHDDRGDRKDKRDSCDSRRLSEIEHDECVDAGLDEILQEQVYQAKRKKLCALGVVPRSIEGRKVLTKCARGQKP